VAAFDNQIFVWKRVVCIRQSIVAVGADGGKALKWFHSAMALNIKDRESEELAAEIASMTGETKTGATRNALRERRDRLRLERGSGNAKPFAGLEHWLETEIWPQIPGDLKGRPPRSKAEIEEILGLEE
jgi:antitoxin VapB